MEPMGNYKVLGSSVQPTLKGILFPKGLCTQIVYTWAPKCPNRAYCKAKVYVLNMISLNRTPPIPVNPKLGKGSYS